MSNENRVSETRLKTKKGDGLTEEQRKKIVDRAKRYVLLNNSPIEVLATINTNLKDDDSPNCYTVYESNS